MKNYNSERRLKIILKNLNENTRFLETKNFIQHGDTSVYEHVINVSYMAIEIAESLNLNVDYDSLIRGALLHDYFLYDWHDKKTRPMLHGFYHPGIALLNAKKELSLNEIEEDIIKKHMFPLTLFPPKYKEAWVVTLADKIVATKETKSTIFRKKVKVGANIWKLANLFWYFLFIRSSVGYGKVLSVLQ